MIDRAFTIATSVAMTLAALGAVAESDWDKLLWVGIAVGYFIAWRLSVVEADRMRRVIRAFAKAYSERHGGARR